MKNETVLFMRWNRPVAGHEKHVAEHYTATMNYLKEQVDRGHIKSFEPVLLASHGTDLGGFIMIRGDQNKIHDWQLTPDYLALVVRSNMLLDRFGVVHGYVGDRFREVMDVWTREIRKI